MSLGMRVHKKHIIEYGKPRFEHMSEFLRHLCQKYINAHTYMGDDGCSDDWEINREGLEYLYDILLNNTVSDDDLSAIMSMFPNETKSWTVTTLREYLLRGIAYVLETADPENEEIYVSWF